MADSLSAILISLCACSSSEEFLSLTLSLQIFFRRTSNLICSVGNHQAFKLHNSRRERSNKKQWNRKASNSFALESQSHHSRLTMVAEGVTLVPKLNSRWANWKQRVIWVLNPDLVTIQTWIWSSIWVQGIGLIRWALVLLANLKDEVLHDPIKEKISKRCVWWRNG